jgi:hypothetical protein
MDETCYSIRNCSFTNLCDAEWDQLSDTPDPSVRFCNHCDKNVYFCETGDDFKKNTSFGRCVALVNQLPHAFGPRKHLLGDIRLI